MARRADEVVPDGTSRRRNAASGDGSATSAIELFCHEPLHPRRMVLALRNPQPGRDPTAPADDAREHQALHSAGPTVGARLSTGREDQDEQLPAQPSPSERAKVNRIGPRAVCDWIDCSLLPAASDTSRQVSRHLPTSAALGRLKTQWSNPPRQSSTVMRSRASATASSRAPAGSRAATPPRARLSVEGRTSASTSMARWDCAPRCITGGVTTHLARYATPPLHNRRSDRSPRPIRNAPAAQLPE
jgi:hypothetical protein